METLKKRFNLQFASDGLTNINFFVSPKVRPSIDELVGEINKIEDVIAAGKTKRVVSVDSGRASIRFDAPFI